MILLPILPSDLFYFILLFNDLALSALETLLINSKLLSFEIMQVAVKSISNCYAVPVNYRSLMNGYFSYSIWYLVLYQVPMNKKN